MTATTRKTPAKATPAKAPAPKPGPAAKAPAPKPAPKVAAPVEVIDTKPSVAASVALKQGKAHTFRLDTMAKAVQLGYKITTEAPFDRVVLFEKGDVKIRVTYSVQDYVRKVEGAVKIEPGEQKKWVRLNAALVNLAK